MEKTTCDFFNAVKNRRTYYGISKETTTTDEDLEKVLRNALLHTPSAFNSQSARFILLLNEEHNKFWDMVLSSLKKILSPEDFLKSEEKISGSFKTGYGTVLFFEDMKVVEGLQNMFPLYSKNFPIWSSHSSGMHQYVVWTALKMEGLGASLQHYGELVEEDVKKAWNLPESWKLIAQMPFGKPTVAPGEKEFQPLEERFKIFK